MNGLIDKNSFKSMPKVDAHLHFNVENTSVVKLARKQKFKLITINVEYDEFGPIDAQQQTACNLLENDGDVIIGVATFSSRNCRNENWFKPVKKQIEQALEFGFAGVKLWKNIGMEITDEKGRYILIDDPRFDPLFEYLEKQNIPTMLHQAEPKNCWMPLAEMTMAYDRDYFAHHPQYYMYKHPEMPGYEELLMARDNRLQSHKQLVTINAHLGSMEWDVDLVARFLDRFPMAYVDTAARVNHLMYQAKDNHQRVYDFFIKYQDRIMYATDFFITNENRATAARQLELLWKQDELFFRSSQKITIPEFSGNFTGLSLPQDVLEKIYFKNALRAFPSINEAAI